MKGVTGCHQQPAADAADAADVVQAAGVASAVLVTIGDIVFDANAFTAANYEDVVNVPNVAGDVNCYECFQLLLLPPLISQLKCLKKLLVIGNQLKAVFLFYLLMRKSRCREKNYNCWQKWTTDN